MPRLLIMACSQRKRQDAGLLPAIERYDGPAFRVLRRYLRTNPADAPDIWILSAKFGLIGAEELISDYDQRMMVQRARELAPDVRLWLERMVRAVGYSELFLCLSQAYLAALTGSEVCVAPGVVVRRSSGGTGKRLSELFAWLHERAPEALVSRCVEGDSDARGSVFGPAPDRAGRAR
jgi:hypothetical protein